MLKLATVVRKEDKEEEDLMKEGDMLKNLSE